MKGFFVTSIRRLLTRASLLALVVLVLAACTEGDTGDAMPDFQLHDSLGVTIAETSREAARAPSRITIGPDPVVQLGEIEGDPTVQFSQIRGVAVLPGPRILIVNGATAELRFFDLEGRLSSSFGRLGDGPGEFQRPYFLHTMPGDSLLIFDELRRSFTLLAADGSGFRSYPGEPIPTVHIAGAMRGGYEGRVLTITTGLPSRIQEGPIVLSTAARLVDLVRQTVDTLAATSNGALLMRAADRNVYYSIEPPYLFRLAGAVSPDGIFLTTPETGTIHAHAWTGELDRIVRIVEPPDPVTEEEYWNAADPDVASRAEAMRHPVPVVRDAYASLERPTIAPSFGSLLVDEEGWLWARVYRPTAGEPAAWLVFDPEGRGHGSVVMPEGLDVRFIGRDHVAGVWQDEFEVEYVRVYPMEGRR